MVICSIMIKNAPYIVVSFVCLLAISWAVPFQDTYTINEPERVKIAMREVGNQLLLINRDSTSIIAPIKQLEDLKYELSFDHNLTILPDSLVSIIDFNFSKAGISKNYIVEVLRCDDREVSYSYEMNFNWDKTIIPCRGRVIQESCHKIEVQFLQEKVGFSTIKISTALGALGILLFVGFRFRESVKKTQVSNNTQSLISLGNFSFYPEQNKLMKEGREYPLSRKECELLSLFIARPNEVIKREVLTKHVWENHGVIVSRSLDTYISKLRKKLREDPSLKIINIHGVGYKLELSRS